MCGIAGFIGDKFNEYQLRTLIKELSHRGPDDMGVWINEFKTVGLAHARLSIRDLTSSGHQPMRSVSGRYCLVYNGEIYNTEELKNKLKKFSITYAGHSDTEILLHCIDRFGVEESISLIDGMFAFALHDLEKSITYLVRDKFGIKPLYYGVGNHGVAFSSEMSPSFRKLFDSDLCDRAVDAFLHYNYIPSPLSIFKAIKKLEPGTFLKVTYKNATPELSKETYWSPLSELSSESVFNYKGGLDDAVKDFENILYQSLSERVVSDVPYGAFLSGGIDSSVIVSGLSNISGDNLNTFSVGFHEKNFNESRYAKIVSDRFKTNHHELILTGDMAYKIAENIPSTYSEPFADSSQIPMLAVSELASKYVKVVFSGDGADELFGGYHNYGTLHKYSRCLELMPSLVSRIVEKSTDQLFRIYRYSKFEKKIRRINSLSALAAASFPGRGEFDQRENYGGNSASSRYSYASFFKTPVHNQMITDSQYYMTDDVLCKVDRASMHHSIEARAPFLDDIRFFRFAWAMPDNIRFSNYQTKAVLKSYLNQFLPSDFINRPKQGFSIPLSSWLQGSFKPLLDKYLSQTVIDRYEIISRKQLNFLRSNINDPYYAYRLWGIFILHQWLEHNA